MNILPQNEGSKTTDIGHSYIQHTHTYYTLLYIAN